ncbi:MAG: hypothetical protein LBC20_09340 [Planctomycetaceae bacterium]|jgi:hypothetical protein|nr:hypothetical protein [Planctomycetaceae bacterium]
MATIAKLAIKISADLGGLLSGTSDTIQSIDNISNAVEKAPTSMKNFGDAVTGYAITLEAIKKTQDRLNNSNGLDFPASSILHETEKVARKLKDIFFTL